MDRPKYVASCSFGKDSIAALLLAVKYDEPLDEAVYCEVMFLGRYRPKNMNAE